MESYLNVIEIRGRSENGVTAPFICVAEDNSIYYAKGNDAGKLSCRNEWIAGCIGKKINLPIPDFKILRVPDELFKYSARDDIKDLGRGLVFGSRKAGDSVLDYCPLYEFINQEEFKTKLLMFDWWIQNEDRWLEEEKGNVNLLWDVMNKQPIVIDHNIAFEKKFSVDDFWNKHIFRKKSATMFSDDFITRIWPEMDSCMDELGRYFSQIPEEWFREEEKENYEEQITAILNRYRQAPEKFWTGQL